MTPGNIELMENYAQKDPNHYWQIIISANNATKPYSINYTAIDMAQSVVAQKIDFLGPLK
jgi:hypothetical protein